MRPARKLRAGEQLLAADGGPVVAVGDRTDGRRHVRASTLLGDGDPLDVLDAHGEMPLPPYIHDAARPTPTATRPSTPDARLGRRPDRRAAPHRRRARRRWPPTAIDVAPCRARRRPRHVRSRSPRTTRSTHRDAQRALPGAGRDLGGVRAARAGCVVAVGTTTVRALESGGGDRAPRRAAPTCSSTAASTFAGRRRADDQLPPAAHDAADDDRRVRRAALARPLRRRRWPRATGSCPSATPCCSTGTPQERRAVHAGPTVDVEADRRRGPRRRRHTPPAARYRTPCFMPVGTRGAVKYLSAADYDAPRRRRSCSATPTT